MKKHLLTRKLIGLSFASVLSMGYGTSQIAQLNVPYVDPSLISIDGLADEWASVDAVPIALDMLGSNPAEEDFKATFKARWSDDNLYLLFEIKDQTIVGATTPAKVWLGDHVEIATTFHKDEIYDVRAKGDPAASPDDSKIFISWSTGYESLSYQLKNSSVNFEFMKIAVNGGYNVELKMPFIVLYPDAVIANGDSLRIEINAGDSEDGVNRAHQLRWSSSGDINLDFSGHGKFIFIGKSEAKPIEGVEISGDTEITSEKGSAILDFTVLPDDPATESFKSAAWEIISGAELAELDEEKGTLTATSADNGTVTVKLTITRNDGSTVEATKDIIISGQTIELTSIQISGGTEITDDGGALALTALLLPENTTEGIVWSVKNLTGKASIDQKGVLTAGGTDLSNGTVRVIVSAAYSALADSVDITLSNQSGVDVFVTSIAVTGENGATEITGLGSLQLFAEILPAEASQKSVTWSVNNESLATVSETGLLTALANGTVTVTAAASDGSGAAGTLDILIQAVGVQDITTKIVSFYPNPVKEIMTIRMDAAISYVEILNLLGQKVFQLNADNRNEIILNLEALRKGIYLLQIHSSNNESVIEKLIKE